MSLDPAQMRGALVRMTLATTAMTLVAVGFAIAHFVYGVDWAIWGFVAFLAAGFAVQLWFIRGFSRMSKGD
jgi:hypothetical protein